MNYQEMTHIRKKALAFAVIGLTTLSAVFAGCAGSSYEHTQSNPPDAPTVGMNSGDMKKDLGWTTDTNIISQKVTVLLSGTRESVEIDDKQKTGSLHYSGDSCIFSYDYEKITGLTCDIKKYSETPYANLSKEVFESGIMQCFANMNKIKINAGRIGTENEKVVCFVRPDDNFRCYVGGGFLASTPGGIVDEFIEGCRMGAKASNSAYGTNMNLDEYIKNVPARSFS